MSRIGKLPIEIPSGVTVTIDGSEVTVKGPKGELTTSFREDMDIKVEDDAIIVNRPSDEARQRGFHGLTRALLNNMVLGVSQGFSKKLEIHGIGYKAEPHGKGVRLVVGYSHPIDYIAPDGISISVEGPNAVTVEGADKQLVGHVAAELRGVRPPEPYKGKGIRYVGEHVRHKAGKTGAK